jgi:hypothetical protein
MGVGGTLLAREFMPALREAGRPLAKATIRAGWTTFDRARVSLAQLSETVDDLIAEVQSERDSDAELEEPSENRGNE